MLNYQGIHGIHGIYDLESRIVILGDVNGDVMWVKQCHKPPIWEWLILPIYSDLGDG